MHEIKPKSTVRSYHTVSSWTELRFVFYQEFDNGVSAMEGPTMYSPGEEEGGGKENNPVSTNVASSEGKQPRFGKKKSGDGENSKNASFRSSARTSGRTGDAKGDIRKVGY